MNKSMTATLKYATSSYKKMGLVAKLIKGKNVNDAMVTLNFTPKKGAKILLKVVKSAVANAKTNDGKKVEELYISKIDIGKGPRIRRIKFVGRSRVHPYYKHRAFVRIVLDTK